MSALLAAIAGAAVGGVAALALCRVLHRLPLRGAAAVPPASADSALPQAWGGRFLEAMMSAAPEPMFVKDHSHRWIMVNRAFAEFFGTTPEAVIGKTDFDFLLEDSARQSWREDEEVLASGSALAREVLVARREGEPRWMLKTKTAVVLPDGTRYVVGMHFDVTEQRRARDEIAGARELLDAVLDAVPVALLAKDADGRFLLVNQAACDMHGVAQDWALGQRDADFYPPEVAARIVAEDEAVRSCDEVRTFEGPVVTLRGQERWALRRKRAFSLPSGGRGVVIALSDVTEQRDAALEVERTRRYLDAIIDAIPAPICVKDRAHRYVTVNTAFCALLGQAKQQLVGRSDIDYLLPHKAAEAYAEDDRAFASPAPMQFQGPGRSSRNADRWYLRTKAAIQVEGGEYITCVTTDITELKQAQSVVERSHAFLDALINAIPHAVFVKDREHRWVMVNDAACRLIGRSREWIIGRSDADQYDAPFIERAWAEDDHVFATGEPIMTETLLDVRHAREIWLLRSKSLIRMPDGAQHIVAVCTDITERHAAQVEAERNRQFLNLVLEAMPQGVFVKDEGGRWLMVNHATARMLGVQREQLEGRLPHEVLQAALADAVVEQDRRVLAHDGPLTFEQSPLQIDGRTLWIMKTASAVRLADGTRYIVGVNTDVSELKAATLQLQHSRARLELVNAILADVTSGGPLETVLANAVRALWRAFPDLRVCYSTLDADGMLHVLHGCQPDAMRDLRGVTLDLNAAPGYLARLRAGELCEARAGSACAPPWLGADAGASLDLPLQHDDARLGLLSLDAPVVQDWSTHQVDTLKQVGDALQAALHAAHTDVQRRRAERETHSARELLDAVMQAVPVVVSVKDQAGRFLFMNQMAQEMLGAPAECFIGRTDLDMYPPAQAQRIIAQDAQARERREVLTFEEILTPVSGAALWVIKRKRGVDLPDGTRAVVTTVYDVTEVKRSEMELRQHRDHLQELVDARTRELREAVEAAQRASQAKSEFLANMSHELRTPMHAVLSFAQLGAERARVGDADVARLEQYFARIQQSGMRLLTLLDDLLDLAKLEAGRMHYELDVHDPAALAAAVVQELTPLADAAQVQLGLEARGPVPALLCDALRLSQVLRNLVGNAIKFSRAGGRVCIELALGAPPPARLAVPQALLLRVLDQGIGIPDGEHDRIFDKFTQSSRTRSKAGGTGLGLPICREIVQAHAGAIWAENRRGAGACFTVALPLNAGVARPVQRMAGQKAG